MSEHRETAQGRNPNSIEIEKELLVKAIYEVSKFYVQKDGTNRKKNKADSTRYRQQGNNLFKSRFHNSDVHAQILKLYTQSIALAPNDSEELSAAYGNRSALLFHLKKFDDCMKDCDLALSVCKSDESKAKFLCRKVQCLSSLKNSTVENACDEALLVINHLDLSSLTKEKYVEILKKSKVVDSDEEAIENESVKEELLAFVPSKEAPCASEAVTIKYNKEWGRHIVAARDIDPGEIIAVEKSYCSIVYPGEMWFYCQNCVKFTWSSIPCEHCIYGTYCSQECRQEAWEKFHKFECEVFPYIWDIDEDLKGNTSAIRLLLLAVNELGGINELRKEILDVENNQDPLKKGFSNDGVFHSNKFRSVFSLQNVRDFWNPEDMESAPLFAVPAVYYLATHTDLFGTKLPKDVNAAQLLSLHNALLFGALIVRIYYTVQCSFLKFRVNRRDFEVGSLGFVVTPFCSLFNHSCNPNIVLIKSENNEMIAYADRPIHEGEQLFVAYMDNNYHLVPKRERQEQLSVTYYFECQCMACLDDWTPETMPTAQNMLLENPHLALKIGKVASKFKKILNTKRMKKATKYEPEVMKELIEMLKLYAQVLTSDCIDYQHFADHMFRIFNRSFGSWFCIPDTC